MNLMVMIMAIFLSQQVMGNRLLSLEGRRKLNVSSSGVGEEMEGELFLNPCHFDEEKVNEYNRIRLVGIQAFVENHGLDEETVLFTECAMASNDYTMIQSLGGGRDYFFYAKRWGYCEGNCPEGKQKREVMCLSTVTKEIATEDSCSDLVKPNSERRCVLPCKEARRNLDEEEDFATMMDQIDNGHMPTILQGMGGNLIDVLGDSEEYGYPMMMMMQGLVPDMAIGEMNLDGPVDDITDEDIMENGGDMMDFSTLTRPGMEGNVWNDQEEEQDWPMMMQGLVPDMTDEDIMKNGGFVGDMTDLETMMRMMGVPPVADMEAEDNAGMMINGFAPKLDRLDEEELLPLGITYADMAGLFAPMQLEGEENYPMMTGEGMDSRRNLEEEDFETMDQIDNGGMLTLVQAGLEGNLMDILGDSEDYHMMTNLAEPIADMTGVDGPLAGMTSVDGTVAAKSVENGGVALDMDFSTGMEGTLMNTPILLDDQERDYPIMLMLNALPVTDMMDENIMLNVQDITDLEIMMLMMGVPTEAEDNVETAQNMIEGEMMIHGFAPKLDRLDEEEVLPTRITYADMAGLFSQMQLEAEDNFPMMTGVEGMDSRRNLEDEDLTLPKDMSIFMVQSVTDNSCDLPSNLVNSLQTNGFTKIVCVFDILIGGQSDFSDTLLIYTANALAEILDQDKDGNVDDPTIVSFLTYKNNGLNVWLAGGNTAQTEHRCENVSPDAYCFGLQTYHGSSTESKIKIATEEVFHMVHHFGWSQAYPEALGADDFTTSVACREMARLECSNPGWWHPENDCPSEGSDTPITPPLLGTCNSADCDCVEFYHQASLMMIGQKPGWISPFMPKTQQGMLDLLSTEFKNMVAAPRYHQLQTPLTYVYNPTGNSEDRDCVGYWEPCDSACTSLYYVETMQRGAGKACPFQDLDRKTCSPGTDACPFEEEDMLARVAEMARNKEDYYKMMNGGAGMDDSNVDGDFWCMTLFMSDEDTTKIPEERCSALGPCCYKPDVESCHMCPGSRRTLSELQTKTFKEVMNVQA